MVCFAKFVITEAVPQYHDIGLPALAIYRGKEHVHSLVGLSRRLGARFSDDDVIALLAE